MSGGGPPYSYDNSYYNSGYPYNNPGYSQNTGPSQNTGNSQNAGSSHNSGYYPPQDSGYHQPLNPQHGSAEYTNYVPQSDFTHFSPTTYSSSSGHHHAHTPYPSMGGSHYPPAPPQRPIIVHANSNISVPGQPGEFPMTEIPAGQDHPEGYPSRDAAQPSSWLRPSNRGAIQPGGNRAGDRRDRPRDSDQPEASTSLGYRERRTKGCPKCGRQSFPGATEKKAHMDKCRGPSNT